LIKKLTDKDKSDWKKFVDSKEKIENKDRDNNQKQKFFSEKIIDLHGYTLEEANNFIKEIIDKYYIEGVNKINVITGKGTRSKNKNDPYQSTDYSILKYSVPNFIKTNSDLMKKIKKINFDEIENPNNGSFEIYLKKNYENKL
tara:strand:+ start:37 stop:465 length:429 start_codon:yes stop_codon:yes gene_type:complete